ncbi:DUF4390 domain-containing protein [Chitiniphilus eburneus]|uniref:DUF4390 domain-containing protein n=1 Tax=Chitiniphilus eburneus TaxID=2571148 RepID=A0A4V5MS66_9NEIS|nr:DUF4390 domain-containing protein [Chitiniphilus eburneus]TJZ78948.1 DUF4390 domain-containing protein [Chitiniphilus eburneus]
MALIAAGLRALRRQAGLPLPHLVRLHLQLAALLLGCLLCLPAWPQEPGIRARDATFDYAGDHVELAARFDVTLKQGLEDALANGFSLPFSYEFQLTRPRLYAWWSNLSSGFDPTAKLNYRLSYHNLSRQYRLHLGNFYRSFSSLNEALTALGVVRNWEVLKDTDLARDKEPLAGRVRLLLDVSQLPKPLQLSAMGKDDWELASGWVDLKRSIPQPEDAP